MPGFFVSGRWLHRFGVEPVSAPHPPAGTFSPLSGAKGGVAQVPYDSEIFYQQHLLP
ncbi:hypothetical protein C8J36_10670 [Rhizobium sp. PP-F2F-G48]|uniref:hypothetical protein n=1 Tax=Rhizobium sp. PP-F2F-G48 TaxID=2135651 RepID=UPI0010F3A7C8|nr:hypothetical protein [Rhizobium sp. PP-F2F-G48]TCM53622.1 hypothetical protein C8J36_10670 [Rhizobium sp. PP-F2F-G48]